MARNSKTPSAVVEPVTPARSRPGRFTLRGRPGLLGLAGGLNSTFDVVLAAALAALFRNIFQTY
jgi:hypothetical protein